MRPRCRRKMVSGETQAVLENPQATGHDGVVRARSATGATQYGLTCSETSAGCSWSGLAHATETGAVADAVPGERKSEPHRVEKVIVTKTDHDFVDLTIATRDPHGALSGLGNLQPPTTTPSTTPRKPPSSTPPTCGPATASGAQDRAADGAGDLEEGPYRSGAAQIGAGVGRILACPGRGDLGL